MDDWPERGTIWTGISFAIYRYGKTIDMSGSQPTIDFGRCLCWVGLSYVDSSNRASCNASGYRYAPDMYNYTAGLRFEIRTAIRRRVLVCLGSVGSMGPGISLVPVLVRFASNG